MSDSGMLINPSRVKGEPRLPAAGMLVINPAEAEAARMRAKSRNGRQHFLFNSKLIVVPETPTTGPFFIAGPAVGAPMAVLTLEKLIALGACSIIAYGWCGSLSAKLPIGDVLLPTWAVSDEGTSSHYPVNQMPESHANTRQLLASALQERDWTAHTGPIWTTDAPYRESKKEVKRLGQKGILAVDMEYSALIAAATFRRIALTAVLLVSDELWSGTWTPGFHNKEFKQKSDKILSFLADYCANQHASK